MPVLFTIGRLLSRYGVDAKDTPYDGQDEVNSCVFDAADLFKIADIEKYKMNFARSRKREIAIAAVKAGDVYAALSSQLEAVKGRLRELSEYGRQNFLFQNAELTEEEEAVAKETRNLRSEKVRLLEELERLIVRSAGDWKAERVLTYKNSVLCNFFGNMAEILPELRGLDAGRFGRVPIFTRAFDELPAKLGGGERFAVVGGPCLLGTGEMLIHVTHRDGRSFRFDFNTGNHSGDLRDYDALGPHIRENAGAVAEILFENRKNSLTAQDYESLRLPVEFARLLDAPVVIPLPDVAYMKYIGAITSCLAPGVRDAVRGDFRAEMVRVTKLFLDAIEELGRRLRPPKLVALHDGDETAMKVFYDARKRYYDKFTSANHRPELITSEADRIESVTDYIFYPALPFYLWGIENIVQVDSIGEADSLRKCAGAHGDALSIFGMLYPEMLDKNALRAMSMADVSDKEYVK
jgi:hypothetical protein